MQGYQLKHSLHESNLDRIQTEQLLKVCVCHCGLQMTLYASDDYM